MAVALVGGAALGAAFGELFKEVRDAKDTISEFRPQLDKLSSTLALIHPIIDDIESFNRVLDRVGEMDRIQVMMTRGVKLVKKSAKVRKVDFIKKHRYAKKLRELNKSVADFLMVVAPVMILREGKEMLVEVKKVINFLEVSYVNGSFGGYFVDYLVPKAPDVEIWGNLGLRFKEIKGKLLQNGFSRTVVTAPRGCGNTTLVTALCHDEEIKGKFRGNIFFIPFSTMPNLADIVQRMALRSGFMETRKELADNYLRQLLQNIGQKPLLIVLDDVWSSAESMLEKFVVSTLPNYKIIVTSRFRFPAFCESVSL